MQWLDAFVQGVLLGGLYAQYALGMALMFGVMRIINIAHGDVLVLLAFVAIVLQRASGWDPFVCLVLLVPLAALFGYGLQRLLLNRVVRADPLASLIATFGLSIAIQNCLLLVFTADPRALPANGLESASVELGSLHLGVLPLIIFSAALLLTGGVHAILARTSFGRALRASASDADAAAMTGVNAKAIYAFATSLAVAILGVAAVFQALRVSVSPSDGPGQLLYAFEAVIIGGMGSIWGAFAGAIALGVAQSVGARFDVGWGPLAGHLLFLVMLAARPQGFFAARR